jgi:hypothetical protein
MLPFKVVILLVRPMLDSTRRISSPIEGIDLPVTTLNVSTHVIAISPSLFWCETRVVVVLRLRSQVR